ncbi:MAG: hypothetical protein JWM57_861 [Phycisphaerales bacterium]|nr:hypothetical protein [Phycisphaerales bacterium]
MTHIEAMESRRCLAANGLDTTFGTNGALTLPGGVVTHGAFVSYPGGYIVEAEATSGTDYLYKITDAGKIDTTWGTGGRVATPAFGVNTLVYDKKYNLLYAAGVTERYTNGKDDSGGDVAALRIERFNGATGAVDTTFGTNGVASFTYGTSNRSIVNRISIGRLLPLAKRGLAVALEHDSYLSSADYDADTNQAIDITLLKYNANGTRDSRFARRGIANVSSGYRNSHDAFTSYDREFDEPTFADLQARDDGSLRVLTLRTRGTSSTANDDEGFDSNTYTYLVQSQVLSARGAFDPSQEHIWRLIKTTTVGAAGYTPGFYNGLLIRADGDDGAVAVGTVASGIYEGDPSVTQVTTMTPAARTVSRFHSLDGRFYEKLLPYGNGYYAVEDYIDVIWSTKLRADFRLSPTYNGGKQLRIDFPKSESETYASAVDIDGRLIGLFGNTIYRIIG